MPKPPDDTLYPLVILTAYALDLVLGDPRWLPHPVRGIGWMIERCEQVLRRYARTARAEKAAGVLLVFLVVSTVWSLAYVLLLFFFRSSASLGVIFSVFLAATTLSARGLGDAAKAVLRPLESGDLARARTELSMIVGRDTAALDERGISRAVVETVAENASDGVIAPLFYLALGGPALALAYKAVNTLDSMVGYRNDKYVNFGWAAARFDDLANFIPARITAILICLAAQGTLFFQSAGGNRWSDGAGPWRIMLRDGKNHPSPNSGYPEAAMAGALGVRLGGLSSYGGRPGLKPFIGEERAPLGKKHVEKSVRLMYYSSLFAAFGAAAAAYVFR